MRTFALFGVKIFRFFKIYGASARTREVEPERTRGRKRGLIFQHFVRTSFMDGPIRKNVQSVKYKSIRTIINHKHK